MGNSVYKLILSALFIVFGWCGLSAETILLESGEIYQGAITNYTNEAITIETDMGPEDILIMDIQLIDYTGAVRDFQADTEQQNPFIIHLKNGEIIEGVITQFSNDFISVESLAGHGLLQLPAKSVNYVTSKKSDIRLNQREGIGYVQKVSTLGSTSGLSPYVGNQLSYKTYLYDDVFGNLCLAYGNASNGSSSVGVFAADLRVGKIFDQIQDISLYYGGAVGYLSVRDSSLNLNSSGFTLAGFLGAELFFPSLPNFGFSAELGVRYQTAGSFSATDLSVSTFPAFSIHYYF